LTEYRMIKKYPKIAVTLITIAVLGSIYGFIKITNNHTNIAIDKSTENLTKEIRLMDGVSKVQRNGYVKVNDGGLTDSIKYR